MLKCIAAWSAGEYDCVMKAFHFWFGGMTWYIFKIGKMALPATTQEKGAEYFQRFSQHFPGLFYKTSEMDQIG